MVGVSVKMRVGAMVTVEFRVEVRVRFGVRFGASIMVRVRDKVIFSLGLGVC